MKVKGSLYLVATPIGNLDDITYRAVEVLKSVDVIYAEDTRETRKLLAHYKINTPLKTYLGGYEGKQKAIIEELENGKNVALVSDRGTPCINDPGYEIVALARQTGIRVVPVPGANAAVTALSAAGFNVDRYYYAGFIPKRGRERMVQLARIAFETAAVVFYESPSRLLKTLKELLEISSPERKAVIFREITKLNEEVIEGSLADVVNSLSKRKLKGEFVVVLSPHASQTLEDTDRLIEQLEQMDLKLNEIASLVSQLTGTSKRKIYERLVRRKA